MRYDIDRTTYAPIVVVSIGGDGDREVLIELLETLLVLYRSWDEPGRIVFDVGEVTAFDGALRRVLATWRAQNKAELEAKITAVAYVIKSQLVRGYFTAVNWLRPHPLPQRVCADLEPALEWIRTR